MTTYERVVDGEVVERVTPVDGSHEDTRIGCAVMDGSGGWRVEADPATVPAEPPADAPTNSPATPQDPTGADSATTDASDAGTNPSEGTDGTDSGNGDGAGSSGDQPRSGRRRG